MNQATSSNPDQSTRALALSTVAFTVCFAVWTIFSIIGVSLKQQLGLSETQFGLLIGTPVLTGSLVRVLLGILTDRMGGRIVYVGSAGRDRHAPNVDLLRPGNKSLIGIFFGAELVASHARVHAMVDRHLHDVAAGRLTIVIDGEYRLADAAAAHRRAESRSAFGRVVMLP